MHSKATSVLVDDNNLRWADGQEELMTWTDFLICLCMKTLIKEKELYLYQGLQTGLLVGYCMTLDNNIKILDPAVQPF